MCTSFAQKGKNLCLHLLKFDAGYFGGDYGCMAYRLGNNILTSLARRKFLTIQKQQQYIMLIIMGLHQMQVIIMVLLLANLTCWGMHGSYIKLQQLTQLGLASIHGRYNYAADPVGACVAVIELQQLNQLGHAMHAWPLLLYLKWPTHFEWGIVFI